MTTTTTTYNWLKHIPTSLLQADAVPLVGSPPPFPWAAFSTKIGELFAISDLKITPGKTFDWVPAEDLLKGLGPHPIPLYVTPIPSMPAVCWVMAAEDIQTLMGLLLSLDATATKELDNDFLSGFYRFVAIEAANACVLVDFDKTLSPHLQDTKELPHDPALCLDISITLKQRTLIGRLIMSAPFRKAWQERYTPRTLDIPKPILDQLNVTVNFEVGRTTINLTDWANVHPGDFVVLDSCSLKPSGEGRITLSLNGAPIFRGKLKDGNIKILEHPLYHEEEMAMNSSPIEPGQKENEEADEAPEENAMDDQEIEDEFEETEDEGFDDLEEEDFEEEHSIAEEDLMRAAPPPKPAAPAPQAAQKAAAAPPQVPPQPAQAAPVATTTAPSRKPVSPENIPLSVVVEVGRVQMSMQKLMELQPGNLLELNVRPENGVDLVVNGKLIAKGELLLVGDALGVRILDIG